MSCQLNFEAFPYDFHECIINFKNWYGSAWRVKLQSPKIYTIDKYGKEIGGSEFNFDKSSRLDYNFNLKSLPNTEYTENGYNYSLAQVKLNFKRTEKSQAEIFSGYHSIQGLVPLHAARDKLAECMAGKQSKCLLDPGIF